jgi:N-acylglucosamine-6-phosphate 2-epimerase
MSVLDALRGGLVVSSQVMNPASPLSDPRVLSLLAQAAELGGAAGFRVDGVDVIRDLRHNTALPIIGIKKSRQPGFDAYITTSTRDALELIRAGADIVAAQATVGSRPSESFAEIAHVVHAEGCLIMADIATRDEAVDAITGGADLIATTMSGHTPESDGTSRPAIRLARDLNKLTDRPIVVEGGIWTGEDVAAAFKAGALAVVVGSAITAPDLIAQHLITVARRNLER